MNTSEKLKRQGALITKFDAASKHAKELAKQKQFDAAIETLAPVTEEVGRDKSDYVLLSRNNVGLILQAKYHFSCGRGDIAWRLLNDALSEAPPIYGYRIKIHEAMATQLKKEKNSVNATCHYLWIILYKIKERHFQREQNLKYGNTERAKEDAQSAYEWCELDKISEFLAKNRVPNLPENKLVQIQKVLFDIAQNHLNSWDTANGETRLREALR